MLDEKTKAMSLGLPMGKLTYAGGGRGPRLAVLSQTSHPVWFPFSVEPSEGYRLPNPLPQRSPPPPRKDPREACWGGEGRSEGLWLA